MILRAENITFGFSTEPLLKDCSFQVQDGDKIALIGPNGTGKTTLLRILTGGITSYEGKIISKKDMRIGYQEQFRISNPDTSLWEEIEKEFQDVIKKITHDYEVEHEHLAFEKKIRSILKGMGFSEKDWQRKLGSFSGGELTRISLARLFLRDYDLLILDEPTNHLDIASVFWLEAFLKSYKGTILMVTHDRELLGGVINQIFEINSNKVWNFRMTYDDYLLQRERMIESKMKEKKRLEIELEKQKKLVKQFETWGHMGNPKAISLMHSREKMVARVERKLEEVEIMEENKTHLGDIPKPERANYIVFECNNLSKGFGQKTLFENVSFTVFRSEKIVLLGRNGIGKSTLLKIMTGETRSDQGTFHYGDLVRFAYLSQDLSKLDLQQTIFEELNTLMPMKYDYEVRAYAGRFGFTGDETDKKVDVLSGGEKLKLSLAKLLLKKPNFLILDEPTNHLDIMSIERLQEILGEYEGAILMVTHDRRLLNYVSDRILVLEQDGIQEVGSVNEYMNRMNESSGFSNKEVKFEKNATDYERQKALKNMLQKTQRMINEIMDKYETVESEQCRIENEMYLPGNINNYQKLNRLADKKAENEKILLELIEKIEDLENEKESLLRRENDV
ncbi:MAG TPA: ATP-binding cassette domain-containing protein [Thermotogota bacterium]|nr:ATP-binding cassette domain-containing protein [Thermotogota bacterium]HRW33740.1 ATP-binding cassette domain-containing protein [Thermotogota bacterium]